MIIYSSFVDAYILLYSNISLISLPHSLCILPLYSLNIHLYSQCLVEEELESSRGREKRKDIKIEMLIVVTVFTSTHIHTHTGKEVE